MRTMPMAILLTLSLAGSLRAQRLEGHPFPSIDGVVDEESGRGHSSVAGRESGLQAVAPVWLVTGGVLGGAAAGFGGMYSGALITQDDCEDCAIVGAIYGLVAGVSTGIPLGVHFTNGGRGDLKKSLLTSLAIGGIGLGVAHMTGEPGIMFGIPVLQLVSSVAIERATGR
jgi:hypothetical protein